jgi:DNA-binding beta-propeller fold protein YncE
MRFPFLAPVFLLAAAATVGVGLKEASTVPLPGVEGRFDHFAADVSGHRLFVAALANNTVEVIDTHAGKHVHTIKDASHPAGLAYLAPSNRLAVGSGGDGTCRFYDANSYDPTGKVDGLDDADNVRYDAKADRVYCGYGASPGALAVIDAKTLKHAGDVKLDAHPESFQLEPGGPRIFVNVPEAAGGSHVAVVDRTKLSVIAKWPLKDAAANYPLALDEKNHRLFVGCRKPAKLLVLDTESGKTVAGVGCVGDTDDVYYDAETQHVYVAGGGGSVTVIKQMSPDKYEVACSIRTAEGARTAYFTPDDAALYVAVPHRAAQQAEIRIFKRE